MKKTRIWAMLIMGLVCFIMAASAYGEGMNAVESIVLDQYEVVLNNGQKTKVVATVSPEDAKNQNVKWTSSDNKVAQVSGNGDITAKGPGTAVITCEAADGNGAKAEVNVTVNQLVSGLQMKGNKLTVPLNATVDAPEVTVKPDNATNKVLSWTSSDETICTVAADGSITAVGAGDCTLTVATTDGSEKTATVSVHVPVFENAEVDVTIDQYEGQLIPIDFHGFSVENITHKASSSKSFLYYLDEEGLFVYPIAKGSGTITLTSTVNKSDVVKYNIDIADSAVYENDDGPLSAFVKHDADLLLPNRETPVTYYIKGGVKPYKTIQIDMRGWRNNSAGYVYGGPVNNYYKNASDTIKSSIIGFDVCQAVLTVMDSEGQVVTVESNKAKVKMIQVSFDQLYYSIPRDQMFTVDFSVIGGSGTYVKFQGFGIIRECRRIIEHDRRSDTDYENYRYTFEILKTDTDDGTFDWRWIGDRCNKNLTLEETLRYAPESWKKWIESGEAVHQRDGGQDIELETEEIFTRIEGARKEIYVTRYERDQSLREEAVRRLGSTCQACGFNFTAQYGEIGREYIEVHHKKPLADAAERVEVNVDTDLAVLCSNCHRMIHRKRGHTLTVEELKEIIAHTAQQTHSS